MKKDKIMKSSYYVEDMPDEVMITLGFDLNNKLSYVKTPAAKHIDGSNIFLSFIPTLKAEIEDKRVGRSIDLKGNCTFANMELSFLFLDVGRWGGGEDRWKSLDPKSNTKEKKQRDFGIICGRHAAICRFFNEPGHKPKSENYDPAAANIKSFLDLICGDKYGIEIFKWESFDGSVGVPPPVPIYVLIGDLHLPIVSHGQPRMYKKSQKQNYGRIHEYLYGTRFKYSPEQNWGRVHDYYYKRVNFEDEEDATKWYNKYIEGDIFKGADRDLVIFLNQIELAAKELQLCVHFVQVGDLYDLWIGLDRYYEYHGGPPGKVELRKWKNQPQNPELPSKEFIEYWIQRTNKSYPELTNKLENLGENILFFNKTFLYGNHDNYLAKYHPGLTARKRFFRQDGVYFEHGHWVDKSNYDGNYGILSGHKITNWVFNTPIVREADPQRRHYYTAAAAIELYEKRDFKIFAMGHTHSPYLTKVKISVECIRPPDHVAKDAGVAGGLSK